MRRSSGAIFDETRMYRYRLWREWDSDSGRVCFVMLNPSAADAERNDPTIRRCIGFAKRWGLGGVEVVNLFAFRTAHPADLRRSEEPVGAENDAHIVEAVRTASMVVAAWGCHGSWRGRSETVASLLPPGLLCLGTTRDGSPRHPLYVRADAAAIEFRQPRNGDPLCAP